MFTDAAGCCAPASHAFSSLNFPVLSAPLPLSGFPAFLPHWLSSGGSHGRIPAEAVPAFGSRFGALLSVKGVGGAGSLSGGPLDHI